MSRLALVTAWARGTGSAIVRKLHAGGYRVAMRARSAERLAALEAEAPGTFALPCDVAGPASSTGRGRREARGRFDRADHE